MRRNPAKDTLSLANVSFPKIYEAKVGSKGSKIYETQALFVMVEV